MCKLLLVLVLMAATVVPACGATLAAASAKNPIRKVVSLLQKMATTVAKEAEEEKEMYDKFICWCQTGGTELQASISESTARVPSLQSTIEESESEVVRLKEDLKQHQVDRDVAKEAISQATALREKDQEAYLKESGDLKGYVAALKQAIPKIETGMAGTRSFLEGGMTTTLAALRRATEASAELTDDDRQSVLSFLSGGSSAGHRYAPKSLEITGILKDMQAGFEKDLAGVEESEASALALYEKLIAAKTKQVNTLGAAIEKKTARLGELAVSIVNMKNELTDTESALIEDQKFLNDLSGDCEAKKAGWEQRVKTRAEELQAIHETIKILSDDDALDLFKKTIYSGSFLQFRADEEQVKRRILAALTRGSAVSMSHPGLRFLEFALAGKKVDFSKVIKMVDTMIALLGEEQADDDHKQEYCKRQLDLVEDKGKELTRTVSDLETSIEERKETIAALTQEIEDLQVGIAELDKSVLEATEQRKKENDEFQGLMSSNSAAKELLEFAKNRLHKFYAPKLYKAPDKREVSDEDDAVDALAADSEAPAFLQLHSRDAPPPPPATYGDYRKKGEETTGVISMLNLLIRDLDKEMTEAQTQERNNQKDYEGMMDDAASKRAKDLKGISTKESSKADTEGLLTNEDGDFQDKTKELQGTKIYEQQLHAECDWLLQNFQLRQTARAQEKSNLQEAKAVLAGADFSLFQAGAKPQRGFLSR